MDAPEIDSFLSACEQMAIALFPDSRHRVRISVASSKDITEEHCLECFCQHFSDCDSAEEIGNILYKTVVTIEGLPFSTIYAVARGAENARRGQVPNCPSSSSLFSLFLRICLSVATGDVAQMLRDLLHLPHPEPTDEETPMQRLAAKMSSTISGVEKEIVTALIGDQGNLPRGMEYSRKHLRKTNEITEGIADVKQQLDELAREG